MGQRLAAPPLPRAGRLCRRRKDESCHHVYAALGRLKAECPALSWGEVKELTLTTQSYAYARVLDGKAVVAVYNNGDSPVSMELQLPVEAAGVKDLLAGCVGSQPILTQVEWGKLKVQLPSNYATLLRLVG